MSELRRANPGVNWTRLQIGQKLNVPGQNRTESSSRQRAAQTVRNVPQANHTHVVRSGDSDWSIARAYGLTVAQLHAMNPGLDFHPLRLGANVRVRRAQPVAQQRTAPAPSRRPVAAAANTRPSPTPTVQTVSRPVAPASQTTPAVQTAAVTPNSTPAVRPERSAPKPVATKPNAGITTINAEINGTNVILRSAPSTNGGRVSLLRTGTVGRVTDSQGEWYRLAFVGGVTGWVNAKFLRNTSKEVTRVPSEVKATKPSNVASAKSTGPSTSSARALINSALSLQGIRYSWGGTSRNGFDCSGFVQYVFRQHGVRLPRTSREQARVGSAVPRDSLRAGDLVFFITRGRSISHVGIYIGNNRFVHASSGGGRIRVDALQGYYSRRYAGARRVSSRFVADNMQDELDKFAATLPVETYPDDFDPEPEPVVSENRGTDTVAP